MGVEEDEDHDEHEREVEGDASGRFLARLKFAFKSDAVAFREIHLLPHGGLPLSDECVQSTFIGVGGDDDATPCIFTIDHVGAGALPNIRDKAQGNVPALVCFDQQFAQLLGRVAPDFGQAKDEIDGLGSLAQLGGDAPTEECGDLFVQSAGLDAVGDGPFSIHLDLDLGDGNLGFEIDVG